MALRGIKPSTVEKRLKALFYGTAGVGKTMAAISFPRPYLIDTEKGATNEQYVNLIEKNGGAIFQTNDFDELMKEVKSLLTEKHEYKTLIIDPLTTLYNDLLDKAAIKMGTEFGRHYSEANKHMKNLLNLLIKLDMNVIITAHSKNEYGQNLSVLGQTYDCYKKLDYLFDIVFEIQKRGKSRIGIIKKSRIEKLNDSETIPFSYDEIADRYGRHILEKDSVNKELSTLEQIEEFNHLIKLLHLTDETVLKILNKEDAQSLEYLSKDYIQRCIDHYKSKINNKLEGEK